ncbi:hypothetical protein J6590_031711 [Homalodisca vitripennis]|nr:hypothetical protein J6590_031711 [Homalodisca vitripennis]
MWIPCHRTAVIDKSFIVTTRTTWNSLPDSIKDLKIREWFNSALNKLFLDRITAAAEIDDVDMGVATKHTPVSSRSPLFGRTTGFHVETCSRRVVVARSLSPLFKVAPGPARWRGRYSIVVTRKLPPLP